MKTINDPVSSAPSVLTDLRRNASRADVPVAITLLIVDDHALIRENWAFIFKLDARFEVLGACGSGEEAIELAKTLRPHVVLMDINLPGMSGVEATAALRSHAPETKIIGVSLHSQPSYARKIMKRGASGYVTKNSSRHELYEAIVNINQGKKYICEEVKSNLAEQVLGGEKSSGGLNALSAREIEIISAVRKGSSSKEIAEALNISVKTVEVHRYNVLKKLNLKNTAALVQFIHESELELD